MVQSPKEEQVVQVESGASCGDSAQKTEVPQPLAGRPEGGGTVRSTLPPELRAVRMSSIERLICEDAAWLLGANGCTVRRVSFVRRGHVTRVHTLEEHNFHMLDRVTFSGIQPLDADPPTLEDSRRGPSWGEAAMQAAMAAAASSAEATTVESRFTDILELSRLGPFTIAAILGPRDLMLQVDTSACERDAFGGEVAAPLNMYKLCAEVVIPRTIVEERICELTSWEEVERLRAAFENSSDLTLRHPVCFSGTPPLPAGLTLHGRLSVDGFVRKRYWNGGAKRSAWWVPLSSKHRCSQGVLDKAPEGFAELENKVESADVLVEGDLLVFRRGISYAERCHDGLPIDVYLSHYWGEPCQDLLDTLRNHGRDGCASRQASQGGDLAYWVCSLANNQHRIDLGGHWTTSPFFKAMQALQGTKGSVLMAMDLAASTLTRIWCIFEMYVCASLDLPLKLYSPDGDVSCGQGRHAQAIAKCVSQVDFRRARSSVESDKAMILKAIEDLEGGIERVEWTVKHLVTDFNSFLCSSQRAEHPITGEPLSLDMDGADMMPMRIGNQRTVCSCMRSEEVYAAKDVCDLLLQGYAVALAAPAGSGKSVLTKLVSRNATLEAGVLSLRVPVAQLAQVARDAGDSLAGARSAQLLITWARKRFGSAARTLEDPSVRYLLILDGLDEAGDDAVYVMRWLLQHVRRLRRLRRRRRRELHHGMLLTSRPGALQSWSRRLQHLGFRLMHLEPLKPQDITVAAGVQQHWRVAVALRRRGLKKELWNTPLMALLFVDLISRGSRLADIDVIGVLRHFVERLLPTAVSAARMQQARQPEAAAVEPLTSEELHRALRRLAWLKTIDTSRFIEQEDVRRSFADTLDSHGQGAVQSIGREAEAWAVAVWQAAARGEVRFLDLSEGVVQFLHQRLQEFLAAEYLWLEGDRLALRCVSGAGRVGEATLANPRFHGTRRLLVRLLVDGTPRPRPPDHDEAWELLCCAAMSNSREGAQCALPLCSAEAPLQILARTVCGPLWPRLRVAGVLVAACRSNDLLRMLQLLYLHHGLGAGIGAPLVILVCYVTTGFAWRLGHFLAVGASTALFVSWLMLAVQLLWRSLWNQSGRVVTLLPVFRVDWKEHKRVLLGYGLVDLRGDDVNLNFILYMGFWKFILVPPLAAVWAASSGRLYATKLCFGVMALLVAFAVTALYTVLMVVVSFFMGLLCLFVGLPLQCLFYTIWALCTWCARHRLAGNGGTIAAPSDTLESVVPGSRLATPEAEPGEMQSPVSPTALDAPAGFSTREPAIGLTQKYVLLALLDNWRQMLASSWIVGRQTAALAADGALPDGSCEICTEPSFVRTSTILSAGTWSRGVLSISLRLTPPPTGRCLPKGMLSCFGLLG